MRSASALVSGCHSLGHTRHASATCQIVYPAETRPGSRLGRGSRVCAVGPRAEGRAARGQPPVHRPCVTGEQTARAPPSRLLQTRPDPTDGPLSALSLSTQGRPDKSICGGHFVTCEVMRAMYTARFCVVVKSSHLSAPAPTPGSPTDLCRPQARQLRRVRSQP